MSTPAVRVQGLRKVYRRSTSTGLLRRDSGEVVAVERVDLVVQPGEVVGLLGPNGAGKTTTIKCLATLVRPTAGVVEIDGVDAVAHPRQAVGRVSALLEGNRNVYWRLTVRENLAFFAGLQGISAKTARPYGDELLERFGLADRADTPARKLSRGMQQKVAVACAVARRASVLLLDEPTLGLDVETSLELRAMVTALARDEGTTVLLSSHDMGVVQSVADRVVVVAHGRVLADAPVATLLAVSDVATYRIGLHGPLPTTTRAALDDAFPGWRDEAAGIAVEVVDAEALYRLTDLLRATSAPLAHLSREEPDLEQVFLSLVRAPASEAAS